MEEILAILDEEEAYAARLQHFLNHQKGLALQAAAFTSTEHLLQYMEQHTVKLLLCEENIYDAMEHPPGCRTILLSEKGRVREGNDPPVIMKFQSAEEILEDILGYYRMLQPEQEEVVAQSEVEMLTFCSVAKPEKASELAYQYARRKAKQVKVFYLCLDPFYLPEGAQNVTALTTAFYYFKQNSEVFREKFHQFAEKKDRMDCLYGVSNWTEMSECSAREMVDLLTQVVLLTKADCIVVDAGNFTEAAAGCMAVSEQIIFVGGSTRAEERREQCFLEQTKRWDDKLMERIKRIEAAPTEGMLSQLFAD